MGNYGTNFAQLMRGLVRNQKMAPLPEAPPLPAVICTKCGTTLQPASRKFISVNLHLILTQLPKLLSPLRLKAKFFIIVWSKFVKKQLHLLAVLCRWTQQRQ